MDAELRDRLAALDTPEMLALDVECAGCGHPKRRHVPWPFEADKSMRCRTCRIDSGGFHRCTCAEYIAP